MSDVNYPRIVLLATDSADGGSPKTWGVGDPHPYRATPTMKVVAMYIHGDVIEIYSFDGKDGIREIVPLQRVRLVREEMPVDIFREELAHAEAGYPDDDDDDLDEPEPSAEQPPAPVPANGQNPS